jgi:glutaredoxin-related protein
MIKLYDYQLDAVDKLKNGSILCGGVGSGKSLTALAYYHTVCGGKLEPFSRMSRPKDLYVITTAHKRDSGEWEIDAAKLLISKDSSVKVYDHEFVVDSWNNIKKYVEVRDSFFIFDEQRVVGSGTWVKAFLRITKHNDWILLSATPGDTWSDYITIFIANGFYKNKTEFTRRHCVYSRFSKYPKIEQYLEEGRLLKFKRDILVDMDFIRPTKSYNERILCQYNHENYKRIMRDRWNIFKDEPIVNAAELCFCLRKVVNSDESRRHALIDIWKKKRKVIVFYNFVYELDILRDICKSQGIRFAEWNGEKHEPVPKSKSWMYLVQYTAGAEGWNCITTDTVVFYSLNYSYKIMKQASGRIDRLNTPFKELYYYEFKSSSGIDSAISRALSQKKKFNESSFVR